MGVLSEERHGQAAGIGSILSSTGQISTSQTDDITPGAVEEFLPATSSDLLNRSHWEGDGKTFETMNALTPVSPTHHSGFQFGKVEFS